MKLVVLLMIVVMCRGWREAQGEVFVRKILRLTNWRESNCASPKMDDKQWCG